MNYGAKYLEVMLFKVLKLLDFVLTFFFRIDLIKSLTSGHKKTEVSMNVPQKILVLLFALGANMTYVHAVSEKEFCDSFVYLIKRNPETKTKLSISNKLKIMFAPKMLINSSQVSNIKNEFIKLEGENRIFIHLEQPVANRESINSFREVQVKINELLLMSQLKEAKDHHACMSLVSENGEDFKVVQNYIEKFQLNEKNLKALTEIQMNSILRKKLKAFERKGWSVQFMPDLFEMYEILKTNKNINQALLIMHSDENGRVYDARKNAFPKGALSNLPENIKKLMIFSCHGEKVVEFYKIKEKISEFDYNYPSVHPSVKSFYETKIPLVAIKGMLKVAKRGVNSFLKSSRECSVNLKAASPGRNLVITLNDEFLGTLSQEKSQDFKFDCKKLSKKANRVGIYHLGSSERLSPSVQSILISTLNAKRELQIKEHLSQFNNQHILTIGTTGGI